MRLVGRPHIMLLNSLLLLLFSICMSTFLEMCLLNVVYFCVYVQMFVIESLYSCFSISFITYRKSNFYEFDGYVLSVYTPIITSQPSNINLHMKKDELLFCTPVLLITMRLFTVVVTAVAIDVQIDFIYNMTYIAFLCNYIGLTRMHFPLHSIK